MNKNVIIGGVAVFFLVAILLITRTGSDRSRFGQIDPPSSGVGLGVNASSTATTTVKLAFPDRTYVQYRRISNTGFYDAYISGTSTNLSAATGAGVFLKASSSIDFVGDSLYTGPIYVNALGTTTLSEGGL